MIAESVDHALVPLREPRIYGGRYTPEQTSLELQHEALLQRWRQSGSPRPIPAELQEIRRRVDSMRQVRRERMEEEERRRLMATPERPRMGQRTQSRRFAQRIMDANRDAFGLAPDAPLPFNCVRYFEYMLSSARFNSSQHTASAAPGSRATHIIAGGAAGAARPVMAARATFADKTTTALDMPAMDANGEEIVEEEEEWRPVANPTGGRRFGTSAANVTSTFVREPRPANAAFRLGAFERFDWKPSLTEVPTDTAFEMDCPPATKRLLAILANLRALYELSVAKNRYGTLTNKSVVFVAAPDTEDALAMAKEKVEAARERTSAMQYVQVRLIRIGTPDEFEVVRDMLRADEAEAAGGGGGGVAAGGGGGAAAGEGEGEGGANDDGILVVWRGTTTTDWDSVERFAGHFN